MYRIMVVHIEVPPLRNRREDIRTLVSHIIVRSSLSLEISDEAMKALEAHHWPGNVRELQNIVEQLTWLHGGGHIGLKDLPPALAASASGAVVRSRERRKRVADHLFEGLASGTCSFWEHVYPMFINRDITRADIMAMVRQALVETSGNYRAVLQVLGMPPGDYKRFLNFLSTHSCSIDFREFRSGRASRERPLETPFSIASVVPAGTRPAKHAGRES
jgi:DNA-binding NtrC family response regulator